MFNNEEKEILSKAEKIMEDLHLRMVKDNQTEVKCKDPGSNENLIIPSDEIVQTWLVLKYIQGER